MQLMSSRQTFLASALASAFLGAAAPGCSPQNPYQPVDQYSTQESEAKKQALSAAVGEYCGNVHVTSANQDFPAKLVIEIGVNLIHSSTSQDPTDIVQQPVLDGNLRIPSMTRLGDAIYSNYPELATAMGTSSTIAFTNGDYDRNEQMIYLPYSVLNHTQGPYGSLQGTLNGGEFQGTWSANANEPFATFDMTGCTSNGDTGTANP
jgi:hypothetical protein